jgi:hypothetical protein
VSRDLQEKREASIIRDFVVRVTLCNGSADYNANSERPAIRPDMAVRCPAENGAFLSMRFTGRIAMIHEQRPESDGPNGHRGGPDAQQRQD